MDFFEKTIVVQPEHLDELQHVNNITYLKWIQEVSAAHWNKNAPENVKEHYYWVVRNHNITYHKQAFEGDFINIKTHVKANKGPLSIRFVAMTNNKTGESLVTSETQWCLLAKSSGRPTRITDEIKTLF